MDKASLQWIETLYSGAMSIDLIIYAVIAIVLISRLWSVFGRRDRSEPQRPNPFTLSLLRPKTDAAAASQELQKSARMLFNPLQSAPTSLLGRLERIKLLDPTFDEKQFLQAARTSFTMIVEDFAKDDLSRIARLLGPKVLPHFKDAIAARQRIGQKLKCKLLRIKDAEVTDANIDGNQAIVTVRFVSIQQNTLIDKDGGIASDMNSKTEELTDIWIFTRDTQASNPDWVVTETRV